MVSLLLNTLICQHYSHNECSTDVVGLLGDLVRIQFLYVNQDFINSLSLSQVVTHFLVPSLGL